MTKRQYIPTTSSRRRPDPRQASTQRLLIVVVDGRLRGHDGGGAKSWLRRSDLHISAIQSLNPSKSLNSSSHRCSLENFLASGVKYVVEARIAFVARSSHLTRIKLPDCAYVGRISGIWTFALDEKLDWRDHVFDCYDILATIARALCKFNFVSDLKKISAITSSYFLRSINRRSSDTDAASGSVLGLQGTLCELSTDLILVRRD